MASVSRLYTGPKVGSCRYDHQQQQYYFSRQHNPRPVVVTFQELTAREEVLRKAGLLKGSNVFVTEDMSRSVVQKLISYSVFAVYKKMVKHYIIMLGRGG